MDERSTLEASGVEVPEMLLMAGDELSDREQHILKFLEGHQDKMTRLLNKTYQDGKQISKLDET